MKRQAVIITKKQPDCTTLPTDEHKRNVRKVVEINKKLDSVATKLAQDFFCHVNWKIDKSSEVELPFRFVQKYFPYAKGGALLIDEEKIYDNKDYYAQKTDILRGLGYRYLYIENNKTLDELVEQLNEGKNDLDTTTSQGQIAHAIA